MGSSVPLREFEEAINLRYGLARGILLVVGIACLLLGLLAMLLPITMFGSMIWLLGLLLLCSGAIKALQLLLGRYSSSVRRRGCPLIALQTATDVLMGMLLLNYWKASLRFVTTSFGLLFLIEGVVLAYAGLRAPTIRSGWSLLFCALVSLGVGTAIVLGLVSDPLRWAGIFVGLKLILFGAVLAWIAWRAPRSDSSLLYGAAIPRLETGELYAVYFGTAFHLGVYIGDGEVVHYLNDNYVYRVAWDGFQQGRTPQHWTYPDLEPVAPEVVVSTALSEVGKTYPYNLLTFNCENFAIFCKTGGKTNLSKYAQIASGANLMRTHPLLGTVAELNTRAVEWLAFHFGGAVGRKLSLSIRRTGAAVTNWLVSRAARG